MKVCIPLLLITFLIALIAMPFAQASPGLKVTVTTDKPYYIPEESVNVNGTLTQNGVSVEDGLVALQVDDPYNNTVAVRTQETGTTPTVGLIEIVEAFPCDPFSGAPKSSFNVGQLFGLKVTVNNTDSIPHYVQVIINAYDASGVTLGTSAGGGTVIPGERFFILAIPIPISAYTGNATAYASVYTDWPKNGGFPYCPETSVSYEIVGTGGSSVPGSAGPEAQNPAPGTYHITFKLSTNHKAGTYTAYAISSYAGGYATASTTFNFEAGGDVAVTKVVPSESQAYQLWTIGVNVTVLNNGTSPIDFNVTAYYENVTAAYEIGTQTINDLAGGAEMNLTFSWALSVVALGLYDIKANATLLPLDLPDTYLDNNEFVVYNATKVKMIGDVDGSAKVDYKDLWALGSAYGSVPGHLRWNKQCDFDPSGKVDYEDLWALGARYGKTTDAYLPDPP